MLNRWPYHPANDILLNEISRIIPDYVFDMHAHIYRLKDLNIPPNHSLSAGPSEVSIQTWHDSVKRLVGDAKLRGGLFFPMPSEGCLVERSNEYMVEQLQSYPDSCGLLMITPGMSKEQALPWFNHSQIRGFKPYCLFSTEKDKLQSKISNYLPEWAWETAHDREAIIMLHIMRERGIADPDNQREIREMCRRYPRAKLILAHCARGFHAPDNEKGLPELRGLENVWFDFSVICEAEAIKSVLNEFGPGKLLWGSDYPVSHREGRCVTLGHGFAWLQKSPVNDTVYWEKIQAGSPSAIPLYVGLESLRAMQQAADDFGLNSKDMQNIFCTNGMNILDLHEISLSGTPGPYICDVRSTQKTLQHLKRCSESRAPDNWPPYYREARGCEVWDANGRHYYDMSTKGIRSSLLGYRDPDVTRGVIRGIRLGETRVLHSPDEAELAELLCGLHPWSSEVKFTCGEEDAAHTAIRIAKAATGRSAIALQGKYNQERPGSSADGIFRFQDIVELEHIVDQAGGQLAGIVFEPCLFANSELLERVRVLADRCGALVIHNEITMGWRLAAGGSHLKFGVRPDIAVFANTVGNGYPIGVVIGTKEAMKGSSVSLCRTGGVEIAAALATVRKLSSMDVPGHVHDIGEKTIKVWSAAAERHHLPIRMSGNFPCAARFQFVHNDGDVLGALFMQYMMQSGFLADTAIYPTRVHTDEIIPLYAQAVDETFGKLSAILSAGDAPAPEHIALPWEGNYE